MFRFCNISNIPFWSMHLKSTYSLALHVVALSRIPSFIVLSTALLLFSSSLITPSSIYLRVLTLMVKTLSSPLLLLCSV